MKLLPTDTFFWLLKLWCVIRLKPCDRSHLSSPRCTLTSALRAMLSADVSSWVHCLPYNLSAMASSPTTVVAQGNNGCTNACICWLSVCRNPESGSAFNASAAAM